MKDTTTMENNQNLPLELILRLERDRVPVDNPVIAYVVLRNRSNQPLTVNGRLLLNKPFAPESMRDISFTINGPPDYFSLVRFNINAGPAEANHFVEIKPGEALERTYTLTKYYSLHEPGIYKIKATYLNTTAHDVLGRQAWIGRVDSPWVTLERTGYV